MTTIKERQLTVVLIGVKGSGKSTLGNALLGLHPHDESGFQPDISSKSCTSNTVIKCGYWLGDLLKPVRIIDTLGCDSEAGRSEDQSKNVIRAIRSEGTIDAFLLVRVSQHPKYDEREAEYLRILMRVFGPEFLEHLVVVFSHRIFPASDEYGQQRTDAIVEGAKEHWSLLADGHDGVRVPMVTLDPLHDEGEEMETLAFRQSANNLYETIANFTAMPVGGIEMARSANESLKQQISRLREMRANQFLGDETLHTTTRKVEMLVEQLRLSRDAQHQFFG